MTDYSEFVNSRIKDPALILSSLDTRKTHILHMMIGFVGEYHEYSIADSRDNIIEELGDMRFYLVGLLYGAEWPTETIITGSCVSDLIDVVKRLCMYSKDEDISNSVMRCCKLVNYLIEDQSLTIEQVDDYNVAKLTKRYATKYTDALASARLDKA